MAAVECGSANACAPELRLTLMTNRAIADATTTTRKRGGGSARATGTAMAALLAKVTAGKRLGAGKYAGGNGSGTARALDWCQRCKCRFTTRAVGHRIG